jgi:hypothetical protein
MATIEEWVQALVTPQRVSVESSQQVLNEVEKRRAQKEALRKQKGQDLPDQKPTLSMVPPFVPELAIDIAPVSVLHRLGVVTTPPVENLADICSTWAYLRYIWAFELPIAGITNYFRLSSAAKSIDFHQKGLLSDQLGVGLAALLMSNYLGAPLAADVSVAMDDPAWPIELQDSASPDYLFFDPTHAKLFVVECKGTQSSIATSYDQLRRGSEQVPSLRFTDGRTPPSLVIATFLSIERTRVFVIDPPADETESGKVPERVSRVGRRDWTVTNDAEFSRATRLVSEAKILLYAGATDIADRKMERAGTRLRPSTRVAPSDLDIAENSFGTFKGMRRRVGLRDWINMELFQGIETNIYDSFVSEEPARTEEEMRAFQSRTMAMTESKILAPALRVDQERGGIAVRSAGPDGSLLQLRISPV